MRRATGLLLILCASASMAQHRMVQLLLPCHDVPSYSKFLRTFGFHSVDSLKDITRMTDGQIFVALMRMDDLNGVHLEMFVDDMPHLDSVLTRASGVNELRDENGAISEIDMQAPGGIKLFIHQSVQGSHDKPAMTLNPVCGAFIEFSVSVTNLDSAVAFWKMFGFDLTYAGNDPLPMARVTNGQFSVGLHQDPYTEPSITYGILSAADKIAAIRASGIEPILTKENKQGQTITASFQAPEGLIVNILRVH